MKHCVVAGGAGAVGGLFAERLRRSGAEVSVVDSSLPGAADITALDEDLAARLRASELVVLAVPEPVALRALPGLGRVLGPDTLLVDTLSVKTRFVTAARDEVRGELLSVNPMFAPALDFPGRPVATVAVREGPRGAEFLRLLTSWGARPVAVTEQEHDRLTGAGQALTHAAVLSFGLALRELDVGIDELTAIAPPPNRTLLALLARIVSGSPEVYWDVQAGNPCAAGARRALATAARRFADLVDTGDEAAFTAELASLRAVLGDELPAHQQLCTRLFTTV